MYFITLVKPPLIVGVFLFFIFYLLIKQDYYHQVKGKTAKELWEYDKVKIDLIRGKGYNLEIVWESDLKEDHTLIHKLIKKYDKR